MDVIIICTLHNVNSFITMNMQISNSDFSKNGKFGETNEYLPRKSLVSFAEKTESIDLSTQGCSLLRELCWKHTELVVNQQNSMTKPMSP